MEALLNFLLSLLLFLTCFLLRQTILIKLAYVNLASPNCLVASQARVADAAPLDPLPLYLAAFSLHSVARTFISAINARKSSSSSSTPRRKVCRNRSIEDLPEASCTRVTNDDEEEEDDFDFDLEDDAVDAMAILEA
jgi:hypothetical protein